MFSDGAHVYVCNAQFFKNILLLFTVKKSYSGTEKKNKKQLNSSNNKRAKHTEELA